MSSSTAETKTKSKRLKLPLLANENEVKSSFDEEFDGNAAHACPLFQ